MSTYVIGDVQGCFVELQRLLEVISFQETRDNLWFVGDLINRGPNNLEVMNLIMSLPNANCVLGNHDLHFLAIAAGQQTQKQSDTVDDLLNSAHLDAIVGYLRHQPLIHYDEDEQLVIVHAGLPPQLSIDKCLELAAEVEKTLQGDDYQEFLSAMYGNEPAVFADHLTGMTRLRVITNCFTRLRYCTANGEMELTHKADIKPDGYLPWFSFDRDDKLKIVFGHWAALGGVANASFVHAVDTGCVWGRELSAIRLEDNEWFSVPATERIGAGNLR